MVPNRTKPIREPKMESPRRISESNREDFLLYRTKQELEKRLQYQVLEKGPLWPHSRF
jgi:hypothetical protein